MTEEHKEDERQLLAAQTRALAQGVIRAYEMYNELVAMLQEADTYLDETCTAGSDYEIPECVEFRNRLMALLKRAKGE